jgi:hypothetical protein
MKSLIAIAFMSIGFSAYACPNFSGEYVNDEFGTYYSISQSGCENIQFIYDEGTVDNSIDGKEYLVNQYDVVVEEGKVLATVKIYSSYEWKNDRLINKQRSETTYANGDVDRDSGWSESYLNKQNDLVTVSHGKDGKETNVDHRVK